MRVNCRNLYLEFKLEENIVNVLTIENKKDYVRLLHNLQIECEGGFGDVIISDVSKEFKFEKVADVIINPFAMEVNTKRVLNKLYQEMKQRAQDTLFVETMELNKAVLRYLEKLEMTVPYDVNYSLDIDVVNLLKISDMKINTHGNVLMDKLIDYFKIMSRMCDIHIFFVVNLKDYFGPEELELLYEFLKYEKINLIIVENRQSERIKGEKYLILDNDRCLIEV